MTRPEYHLTIKDFPEEERPRERLLRHGPRALSNTELLAILIRTGTRRDTALGLARRLLRLGHEGAATCQGDPLEPPDGLRYLAGASFEELARVQGIGPAKAAQILAAIELGRRLATTGGPRAVIRSPSDARNLLSAEMRDLDKEHFRAILLDTKNQVLGVETVSVGSLDSSLVHPREVFKGAVKRSAAAIILVHNHPSGDPTPSGDDIRITRQLIQAGRIMGIEVLDHLILGEGRYLSFREQGIAWEP